MSEHSSWGYYPAVYNQHTTQLTWLPPDLTAYQGHGPLLPYGLGRSQGDSCLNEGGMLLDTSRLNRLISFDEMTGILRAESGVTLADIAAEFIPRNWFLWVTPGTKYVTLGGAIANDVHGKNQQVYGTFGRYVERFELLRSDGHKLICSPTENPELFAATIGGLGLTGLITWVEIRLRPVTSDFIDTTYIKFRNIPELFTIIEREAGTQEYLVAQLDVVNPDLKHIRGIAMFGNHGEAATDSRTPPSKTIPVPVFAPDWLLNPITMGLYYRWYYHKQWARRALKKMWYDPYFYPLDSIAGWNKLYGRRGFLQYQYVVPKAVGQEVLTKIITILAAYKQGSYLTSLKLFGDMPSPGLLSFPMPGVCVAFDLPMKGESTLKMLEECDAVVRAAGGRVYPAKDARMSAESFQAYFPKWQEFSQHVDPAFSSSFWRRVIK